MTRAVDKAGVVGTVPFVYRYHPLVHEMRRRRKSGEFGRWYLLHGSYLQDWMLDSSTTSWRVDVGTGGRSRAFADIGSHWCDLVEWVSGEHIIELTAQLSVAVPDRPEPGGGGATFAESGNLHPHHVPVQTEDTGLITFRTDQGTPGSLVVSQVSAGRKNRLWLELDGSEGSVTFDQERSERLVLGARGGSSTVRREASHGSAEQRAREVLPAGHVRGYPQCFEDFVADTYLAVRGASPESLPTFADGLRSALLVETALRSSTSRRWEEVG
jgi:predicted dehydrogenase